MMKHRQDRRISFSVALGSWTVLLLSTWLSSRESIAFESAPVSAPSATHPLFSRANEGAPNAGLPNPGAPTAESDTTAPIEVGAIPGVLVPATSEKNEVTFQLAGTSGYAGRIVYQCGQVEAYTIAMLKHMGAQNVTASCGPSRQSGSAASAVDPATPIYKPQVRAQFDSLRLPTRGKHHSIPANWQRVAFMGMDNCTLTLDLFKNLRPFFELSQLHGANSCGFENGPYKLTVFTLFPN